MLTSLSFVATLSLNCYHLQEAIEPWSEKSGTIILSKIDVIEEDRAVYIVKNINDDNVIVWFVDNATPDLVCEGGNGTSKLIATTYPGSY